MHPAPHFHNRHPCTWSLMDLRTLWSTYPRLESLVVRSLYLWWAEFCHISFQKSVPVCTPIIMQRHFHFFNSHHHLLFSNSLIFAPLIGINWHLTVLIFISLIICEFEYFFLCLWVICISSSVNYPLIVFVHFSSGFPVLFCFVCVCVLLYFTYRQYLSPLECRLVYSRW